MGIYEHKGWVTTTTTGTLSAEVDLGSEFPKVAVNLPASITSGTVSLHISPTSGGAFVPLYALDDDATGGFASTTTAATTAKHVVFETGAARYVKVAYGASQTAEVAYVKGAY